MIRQRNPWTGAGATASRLDAVMAHRRGLLDRRALQLVLVVLLLAGGLAGALLVSVQTTRLRAELAELEDRRACLLAQAATLEMRWAAASDRVVVRERARRELGLVAPAEPDFVLVAPDPAPRLGPWQRLLAGLAGDAEAAPAGVPGRLLTGAMISLQPRSAHAATGPERGS